MMKIVLLAASMAVGFSFGVAAPANAGTFTLNILDATISTVQGTDPGTLHVGNHVSGVFSAEVAGTAATTYDDYTGSGSYAYTYGSGSGLLTGDSDTDSGGTFFLQIEQVTTTALGDQYSRSFISFANLGSSLVSLEDFPTNQTAATAQFPSFGGLLQFLVFAPNANRFFDDPLLVYEARINSFSLSYSVATTPLPSTLPLFASALGGIGFMACKRRQRRAA
jgi:hypothetical protein